MEEANDAQNIIVNEIPEEITDPKRYGIIRPEGNKYVFNILTKTSVGIQFVVAYNARNRTLTKNTRSQLVRIILKNEFDTQFMKLKDQEGVLQFFRINSKSFVNIAEEISIIFPGENPEVYYKPAASHGNKIYEQPSGKIHDHFGYLKRIKKKEGVLSNKKEKSIEIPDVEHENNDQEIHWLKNNIEPEDKVLEAWKKTFQDRRKLLLNNKETNKVTSYTTDFQFLRVSQGFKYIKSDFNTLFPDKENIILERWNVVKSVLIDSFKDVQISDPQDNAYLLLLTQLSPDNQVPIIFYLLPYLIDGRCKGNKRKANQAGAKNVNYKRHNLIERRDGLLLHFNDGRMIESGIDTHISNISKKRETLQPTIVLTGPLVNIQNAYVVFDKIRYEVKECLEAVIVAFETFFSLHLEYPESANQIWLFLQRAIFDIKLPSDRLSISVLVLLGKIDDRFKNLNH